MATAIDVLVQVCRGDLDWLELLDHEWACDTTMLEGVVVTDFHIGPDTAHQ